MFVSVCASCICLALNGSCIPPLLCFECRLNHRAQYWWDCVSSQFVVNACVCHANVCVFHSEMIRLYICWNWEKVSPIFVGRLHLFIKEMCFLVCFGFFFTGLSKYDDKKLQSERNWTIVCFIFFFCLVEMAGSLLSSSACWTFYPFNSTGKVLISLLDFRVNRFAINLYNSFLDIPYRDDIRMIWYDSLIVENITNKVNTYS